MFATSNHYWSRQWTVWLWDIQKEATGTVCFCELLSEFSFNSTPATKRSYWKLRLAGWFYAMKARQSWLPLVLLTISLDHKTSCYSTRHLAVKTFLILTNLMLNLVTLDTCHLFQMGQSMHQRCMGEKSIIQSQLKRLLAAQAKFRFAITWVRGYTFCPAGKAGIKKHGIVTGLGGKPCKVRYSDLTHTEQPEKPICRRWRSNSPFPQQQPQNKLALPQPWSAPLCRALQQPISLWGLSHPAAPRHSSSGYNTILIRAAPGKYRSTSLLRSENTEKHE